MAQLFTSTYQFIDRPNAGFTRLNAANLNPRFQSLDDRLDRLERQQFVTLQVAGSLSVGAVKVRFIMPFKMTNPQSRIAVVSAPTGDDIICDVSKAGVTIYTTQANRPKIVAGATSGALTPVADVATLNAGDVMELDIDQVGSGSPGSGLWFSLLGERSA
jgi:hypothetical protein